MTRTPRSSRRFVHAASALAMAVALGIGAGASLEARAQDPITVGTLQNGAPVSFADLIERVSPAVVSVNVTTEIDSPFGGASPQIPPGFEEFFRQFRPDLMPGQPDEPQEGRSLGSGFIISPDGYIVTNNHVVANATKVTVTLKEDSDKELDAEIVGVDESTDLAVLKVKADQPLPFVEFETGSKVRVGDWVVAVGNPFGLGGTATAGIISATGREIGGQYNDFIQIDAPINRGNSGGPTFDLSGRVVGVNSQIFSPSGGNVGIGFAIPANIASDVVDEIISEGRVVRGWLGVTIESVTPDIAASLGLDEAKGAIVANVVAGGPAEKAGFEVGDVVISVEGEEVDSNLDLTRKVGDLDVGERVRFRVLRDEREQNLTVTIGERPSNQELASLRDTPAPGDAQTGEFGLALAPLDDATRERLELGRNAKGVVIVGATRGGEAAEKGLAPGDVILEVAGQSVDDPAQFAAAVQTARESGRSAVLLLVQTERGRQFVALPLTAGG